MGAWAWKGWEGIHPAECREGGVGSSVVNELQVSPPRPLTNRVLDQSLCFLRTITALLPFISASPV